MLKLVIAWIGQSFLWCSGVDLRIAKELPLHEQNRFKGFGALNLVSSTTAVLSASFAISLVTDNILITFVAALLWGTAIFTTQRFLIAAPSPSLWMLLPRLIISVFVGILITHPLLLFLFQNDIAEAYQSQYLIQERDRINSFYDGKINANLEIIAEQHKVVSYLQNRVDSLEAEYRRELSGIGGTGLKGYGRFAKLKEQAYTKSRVALEQNMLRLQGLDDSLSQAISTLRQEKQFELASINPPKPTYIDRAVTLSEIKDLSPFISYAGLLLGLYAILIDALPVTMRIMSKRGDYDSLALRWLVKSWQGASENSRSSVKSNIDRDVGSIESANDGNKAPQSVDGDEKIYSGFEAHLFSTLTLLENSRQRYELGASNARNTGIIISLFGIAFYAIFIFLWVFQLRVTSEEIHLKLYGPLATSFAFIFVQFLSGWYLKQYRNLQERALKLLVLERKFDRYYLGYLAIADLSQDNEAQATHISSLIQLLSDDAVTNTKESMETSFAQDAINSISKLADILKKKS